MASKEKYIVQTELDSKQAIKQAKELEREINNIGKLAKETNKNAKITGSMTMKDKGLKETQRALNLAKKNVDNLSKALAQAKLNNATPKQIQNLESQLIKAQTQAQRLSNEIAQVGTKGTGGKSGISGVLDKAKGSAGSLLGTFSKMGNVITGIKAGWDLVSGTVSKVAGLAGSYAQRLMNTYDLQKQAQKTLSTTLSDGAKGYEKFNENIDKGNALIKSQKNDLNELGATISSYIKIGGEDAYELVNAINAVGDSLGLSMDAQKQFTYGLAQALGSGKLNAQDFNQMMNTALGAQFRDMLIQAANEMKNVGITAKQLPEALKAGKVSADTLANTFGDNWAQKMAKAQSAMKGIEVSAGGVKRELKNGTLTVEDFTRVFGSDFTTQLVNAMNATTGGTVTMENFRQAMEDGVFNTEVMNRALELFKEKGNELASTGPSTFGQIKQMITNGFDTSSLEGFRKGLGDVGLDMAQVGNGATELSTIVGQQMGQMAGRAVGSIVKIIDANKDGKVSNEEFERAVNNAKRELDRFFDKARGAYGAFSSFGSEIFGAIQEISDLIGWLDRGWQAIDRFLSKARDIGGKTGLLGKALGIRSGDSWGDAFKRGIYWANAPLEPRGMNFGRNIGLAEKLHGAKANHLPMDLQLFAGYQKAVSQAISSVPTGINAGTPTPTIGTQDNRNIDINLVVQGNNNPQATANEVFKRLERNGIKLPRR